MKFSLKQLILAVTFIALLLGVSGATYRLWQKSNEAEVMQRRLEHIERDSQNVRSSATAVVYRYRIRPSGKMKTVLITDVNSIQRIADAVKDAPRDHESAKSKHNTSTDHFITFVDEQNAGMDQVRVCGDHLLEFGGNEFQGRGLTDLMAEFQNSDDEVRE